MTGARTHSLVKLAEWRRRGSEVTGEMKGCVVCGLILVNDRRGMMLIGQGGLGVVHKHLFPTQRTPKCPGEPGAVEPDLELSIVARRLSARHDPSVRVTYEPRV